MVHSKFCSSSRVRFKKFIGGYGRVDIPFGDHLFTWCNKWGSKVSKLGMFLLTLGFINEFPHLFGFVQDKNMSDHRCILF